MLAQNKGDVVLPALLTIADTGSAPNLHPHSLVATATLSKAENTVLVKVVNAGDQAEEIEIRLNGAAHVEPTGTALLLTGEPEGVNSVDEPQKFAPRKEVISDAGMTFHRTFPPHSFTIVRLRVSAK